MLGRYTTGPRPVADDSRHPRPSPPRPRPILAGPPDPPRSAGTGLGRRSHDVDRREHASPVTLSTQPEARAYARTRWALLRDRLSTVTPEAIGRGALAVGVIGLSVSLAVGSWPALAPFIAGLVIAYAVLPIANRLDRFMPRFLAALIAEIVALAIIVGVLAARRAAAAPRAWSPSPSRCRRRRRSRPASWTSRRGSGSCRTRSAASSSPSPPRRRPTSRRRCRGSSRVPAPSSPARSWVSPGRSASSSASWSSRSGC